MSRLSNLFRSSAVRPARKVRLGVEALGDRLVPSVTFQENTASNRLEVLGTSGNNTVTVRNNGNGNLTITGDGVTRTFTGITSLYVGTGDGRDTVTYNQGTATQAADTRRSFALQVDLGENATGLDRFTANVFGNVGFVQNGTLQDRYLSFYVNGRGGADRIDLNLTDTDVRSGSTLTVDVNGVAGDDNITVDMDGEVDGTFNLSVHGGHVVNGFDNDTIAVNILLDTGSSGSLGGGDPDTYGGAAIVTGDLGDDTLRFAIRHQAGSNAEVNAVLDGGFNAFDNDVGRHTSNVQTEWLEQDIVIQ